MMQWMKRGRIFNTADQFEWMAHHASVPIADPIDDQVVRIYFGPRDHQGRTRTAFIEVDADDLTNVRYVHDRPALDLGPRGAFDETGVMPSCIVNDGPRKYLYYTGWAPGITVPYRNAIGLAVSTDGGVTFERVCERPVTDSTGDEPSFCNSPFVMVENGRWRMWHGSGTGWHDVNGRLEPQYHIAYAESVDGLNWSRPSVTCIGYARADEANGRPWIVKERDRYRMWYCYRSIADYRSDKHRSYRIGYAESVDGLRWQRLDHLMGLDCADEGWDSAMIAYPCVFDHHGVKHLLYVGNGFGEAGFGYAVLEDDGTMGN